MAPLEFSPYIEADSGLHRRDPRVKVVGAVALVLAISLLPAKAWQGLLGLTLATWALARVGRVGAGRLLRRSLVVLPFLVGALVLPFTTPGEPIGRIPLVGGLVTAEGAFRMAELVWRAWLAVQAFVLLSATTRMEDILWSLQSLRIPPLFVAVVGFTYRYLYVLSGEAGRMLRARRARIAGGRDGPPVRDRLRSGGGLIGTLLLRGLARSERVYGAMAARGYDGTVRRLERGRLGWADWGGLAALIAGLAVVLFWATAAR